MDWGGGVVMMSTAGETVYTALFVQWQRNWILGVEARAINKQIKAETNVFLICSSGFRHISRAFINKNFKLELQSSITQKWLRILSSALEQLFFYDRLYFNLHPKMLKIVFENGVISFTFTQTLYVVYVG